MSTERAAGAPLGVWGEVEGDARVSAVRIERAEGGSFLVLTREGERVFDTWIDGEAELATWLAGLSVRWPPGA